MSRILVALLTTFVLAGPAAATAGASADGPARSAGASADGPARSAVASAGEISVSASSVSPGQRLRITGKMPGASRRTVLQSSATSRWTTVSSSYTNRKGRFDFRLAAPATPGQVRYRVHAPRVRTQGRTLPAVATRAVAVTVVDPRGSRTNPYALGEQFRLQDWLITVHATDYDAYPAMDPDIADPPDPGWSYVAFFATYEYNGPDASSPWLDLSSDFLAEDHRVYDRFGDGDRWCTGVDPDVNDVDDMYAGASVSAHDCATVPTSLARGGLWRIRGTMDGEVFVAAG